MAMIIYIGCNTLKAQANLPAVDSFEIQKLAKALKQKDIYPGIFHVPAIGEDVKPLKSGLYPELDSNFLPVATKHMLLKMYTVSPFGDEFDSLVYIQNPTQTPEEGDVGGSFFSFPGITWFLIMKKCIPEGGGIAQNWLKNIYNYKIYNALNKNTAYYIANPFQESYYFQWNKRYDYPATAVKIDPAFAEDAVNAFYFIKKMPAGITPEEYAQKMTQLAGEMKTEQGKYLVTVLFK